MEVSHTMDVHLPSRYSRALAVSLLLAVHLAAEEAIWPQWRGPTRDGRVSGPAWPASLQGENLKQLWRVELGPSYSGPIVTAESVFVTETRDGTEEVVRALDRATGKERWRAKWKGSVSVPAYARGNGEWIRSTPAWDGECLYVAGMRDVLVCLDGATGTERWRVDFVEKYKTPVPPFGFASSPLIEGDAVYVQAAAAFVKLEKKTGKVLWRVLPYESTANGTAVSSPVSMTLAGKAQLVVQQPRKLAGVDPASGEVLWSQEVTAFRTGNIITPTQYKDGVLTSTFGGRTHFFNVARQGERLTAETAWTHNSQGYLTSPVVVNGHAYLLLRNQRLMCLDLARGEEAWVTSETFGKYWSMAVQGDRVLALDERGVLYLFKANPAKFELLDSRTVTEAEAWAHLAVCGDELFVRDLNGVTAYRWREVKSEKKR
jgi:outer membrane protein assembly factor BamB